MPRISQCGSLATIKKIDFKHPRLALPNQNPYEYTNFRATFPQFSYVNPLERDRSMHMSDAFNYDAWQRYSILVISPGEYDSSSFVVIKKGTRDVSCECVDVWLESWDGSRQTSPAMGQATKLNMCPKRISALFRSFSSNLIEVFQVSGIFTEHLKKNGNKTLNVYMQFEEKNLRPRAAYYKTETMQPNGPFADLTLAVRNNSQLASTSKYEYVKVDSSLLAGKSEWFRREIRKLQLGSVPQELIVDSVDFDAFYQILRYCYSGEMELSKFDADTCLKLYHAVTSLGIKELDKPILDRYSFLLTTGPVSAFEAFRLGMEYDCDTLKAESAKAIGRHSARLLYSTEWQDFSRARPDLTSELLKNLMSVTSVNSVKL